MKLIFLHIPKAGGTTLHSILERLYGDSDTFTIKVRGLHLGVDEFTSLPDYKKQQIQLLKGHMPFGLHSHFKNEEAKYITIFRNPVDRIQSHYEYVLRHPKHYLHDKVRKSNMSLLDYALSDLSNELDNYQCRSFLSEGNISINNFSDQSYAQAIENLQRYFISFGLVEEFDKTLLLFRHELGWKQFPYYVKLNAKPETQNNSLSAEVINKISVRNHWDVRLYNYAKGEFLRRLQRIPHLDEELEVLRISCEAYKAGIDRGLPMPMPRRNNKTNTERIKSLVRRLLGG